MAELKRDAFAFPEYNIPFGNISFEYLDDKNLFIISFSPGDGPDRFQEGSIYISTNPISYFQHKNDLLMEVELSTKRGYKNGVELQIGMIALLRYLFNSIEVDPYLSESELSQSLES